MLRCAGTSSQAFLALTRAPSFIDYLYCFLLCIDCKAREHPVQTCSFTDVASGQTEATEWATELPLAAVGDSQSPALKCGRILAIWHLIRGNPFYWEQLSPDSGSCGNMEAAQLPFS